MYTKHGFITTKKRSNIMKKIKGRDTTPELIFRKALWGKGYRYRKNVSNLPGKPDIVFTKKKVAIFIDGEFWHGYNWEDKKKKISNNKEYWIKKIEKNIERDKKNVEKLQRMGFYVLRFWEHEVKKDLDGCLKKTCELLEKINT